MIFFIPNSKQYLDYFVIKKNNTISNNNSSSNNSHLPNNMGIRNSQIQMENVNINGVNRNAIPDGTNESNEGIDENLYSRQL